MIWSHSYMYVEIVVHILYYTNIYYRTFMSILSHTQTQYCLFLCVIVSKLKPTVWPGASISTFTPAFNLHRMACDRYTLRNLRFDSRAYSYEIPFRAWSYCTDTSSMYKGYSFCRRRQGPTVESFRLFCGHTDSLPWVQQCLDVDMRNTVVS